MRQVLTLLAAGVCAAVLAGAAQAAEVFGEAYRLRDAASANARQPSAKSDNFSAPSHRLECALG